MWPMSELVDAVYKIPKKNGDLQLSSKRVVYKDTNFFFNCIKKFKQKFFQDSVIKIISTKVMLTSFNFLE